jgi:type IV secretory pathway VirB2 component (pilin)
MDILPRIETAGQTDLGVFILELVNWAINFAALLAVIMIIVAGFKYITSMGDEKRIQEANRSLILTLFGLILVFLAPSVIQFVLDNFLSI